MIRLLFPLIGFFCTATVITAVGFYGYLRQGGTLDDEKMFRIMALLHDVDLEKVAEKQSAAEPDVPPEEVSVEQRQNHLQVSTILLQAKSDDLDNQLQEFETRFRQLSTETSRYQGYKQEVEKFLEKAKADAEVEGLVAVGTQLQNMIPKKQTKPLLIEMIKEGRMDQVIQLLNRMPAKKRSDILKTFDTKEDLDMLAKIQKQMLSGDPVVPFVESQLEELNKLKEQESL